MKYTIREYVGKANVFIMRMLYICSVYAEQKYQEKNATIF